jgi:two-component system sensor histidine kinase PilS (NtrC family)
LSVKTEQDVKIDNLVVFRRRVTWFLLFRLVVASLFLGGTIAYQLQVGLSGTAELPFLYWLVAITYLQSGLSAFFLLKTDRVYLLTQTIVAYDLLQATFLIYLTGSFGSHFSFLYILIIVCASLFLHRRHILFVASAAAILYGSLLDLHYYHKLPLLSGLTYPDVLDGAEVFYAVFLHVSAFLLTAVLCSALVGSRLKSERALEKKATDLVELESLNQTILANITSGLMLVDEAGRIRSFNKAAENVTGFSSFEILNCQVQEIFPCFELFDNSGFCQVVRGQTTFKHKSGQELTLGYSATQVQEFAETGLGLLVVFQDLTESIEMDLRLRRADQQAAVGRLASGMAHEIRNPLASISGSVQLLLEGRDVCAEDRRLMQIVVSEADRLSLLLTDFLSFAKPPKPKPAVFDISELCDQVTDILRSDHRFAKVNIVREYVPHCSVFADSNLIQQVLLDLAINAAEAMHGEGDLIVGFDVENNSLYIEDSGEGIDAKIASRIFEPFFTTKEHGTGLGLATVHTIIEAHDGYIDVVNGRHGGAKFVITFTAPGQNGFAVFDTDTLSSENSVDKS